MKAKPVDKWLGWPQFTKWMVDNDEDFNKNFNNVKKRTALWKAFQAGFITGITYEPPSHEYGDGQNDRHF